eukprot:COSAG02_NODE_1100_length_14582_cov_130.690672_16_plen_44_part_00
MHDPLGVAGDMSSPINVDAIAAKVAIVPWMYSACRVAKSSMSV